MNEKVLEKLKEVIYPGFKRDIVAFEFVKEIDLNDAGNEAIIRLEIPSSEDDVANKLTTDVTERLQEIGVKVSLQIIRPKKERETSSRGVNSMPNVKSFIMVSSGKGGVGKSTTTVNLAIALAAQGKRVGVLDGDIYGPNISRMFGREKDKPEIVQETKVKPFENYGVKFISMANLIPDGTSLMWRGAMIPKALEQFMRDVEWGELDVLVIDMPPGTGDAQMTMAQKVPVTAGVAVTTPQAVALDDARRSLDMFRKLHIPLAGIVENMSGFICPETNKEYDIFGKGSAEALAREYETGILAEVPIEMAIREGGDEGKPIVAVHPESESAKRYLQAADNVWAFIENVLEEDLAGNEMIQPIYGVNGTPSACSM